MAVKVGNSWVSEAALAYARSTVNKEECTGSDMLSHLSEKYKDTGFTASTAPFQGKGNNNIGISPNILRQMEQDPEKRLEYEALIYDCVQVAKNAPTKTANGSNIVASGFIIHADGSLSGWSISKSGGEKTKSHTKLDKKDKESWYKKLFEKQEEKPAKRRKQQKADSVSVEFSKEGMELAGWQNMPDTASTAHKRDIETETHGSQVSFNEGKRARQLAAAKTVESVQVVMGLLQKDLADCQAGLLSGACDENEVAKVKAMIAKAQQKMAELQGEGSDREMEKQEDTLFSLNLLM